jgi:hypothetical protein
MTVMELDISDFRFYILVVSLVNVLMNCKLNLLLLARFCDSFDIFDEKVDEAMLNIIYLVMEKIDEETRLFVFSLEQEDSLLLSNHK